ncbi:probable tubulin polyglutamylase TTLL9 isoform X3 [Phyllopteryx taeniolatus]|uniref:probable tubulin polyglutamylase TTLL9 isoform X3 n=1 Tax=Phyllopteryx taeniolatus TaxID=161469 RepID=UPI002AD2DDC5|nr:probable tubulin polyglutamylase TTLL9 isoform X3 [Phyllopteryx taeniolatus]
MSPDRNPIEHLWKELKHAVWRKNPPNLRQLEQFAHKEWAKIPAERCKSLIESDGEWDFHWCGVGWLKENLYMEEHVRVNHFRNHYELTRKDFMLKNLKRFKKNLEREASCTEGSKCDFFPCTFALPNEYHLFVEEFKRNPGSTWIMKPAAKSQGAGIFLFKKLKDIMEWRKHDGTRSEEQKDAAQVESYVAQRYIENPYLLGGRKFDLRVYLMVTSYFPLKAWLYREGFARLSSTRFSLSSIDDKYVHLTNVAVQKTAPDYDPEKGCKWKIQKLRRYLTAKHGRQVVESLFKEMDNIFISSLQSVQKIIINDKHCFELYGYDIMLDENLKPLTGKEKRVGGYDLIWNDGPVYSEDVDPEIFGCSSLKANTYLGCANDREHQLNTLVKLFPGQKRI